MMHRDTELSLRAQNQWKNNVFILGVSFSRSFTLLLNKQSPALAPRMKVTSSEEALTFTQGPCSLVRGKYFSKTECSGGLVRLRESTGWDWVTLEEIL